MTHPDADLNLQARRTADAFTQAYGQPPTFAVCAPGRVNLIGEHTDYNDGFVLPLAIQRQSMMLAQPRQDTVVRLRSTGVAGEAVLDLAQGVQPAEPTWSNYLRGVLARWLEENELASGFDAMLDSTVPTGGGLSSSASIEVAMATMLEALTATQLEPENKALMAQWAEHHYANVPCGIMDQFASTLGHAGHALLLDCRSQHVTHVPIADDLAILITNSNKAHELVGGEYAERRAQCESAAKKLGVPALRDATTAMLDTAKDRLDQHEIKRARHVITEDDRVIETVEALKRSDWPTVGQCMYDSHASMRDDFEITTPELDTLVDLAAAIGPDGGVIGSRMTGGGFGGCTVTLAHAEHADAIAQQLAEGYKQATGLDATVFTTQAAQGARVLDLSELLA